MLCDVERTHAKRVSRQHQLRTCIVPERDGPLPVEATEGVIAPLLEGVDDHLGVAAGSEDVAQAFKLVAQLDVVEDLAVEDDPQRAVLIRERLLAAGEVDDREPRMTEPGTTIAIDPELVRTAVLQRCRHPSELIELGRWQVVAERDDASDAAHQVVISATGSTSIGRACKYLVVRRF